MKNKIVNSLPYLTILIIICIALKLTLNLKYWKKDNAVVQGDVVLYYAYLPASVIYHDITLNFIDKYKGPHKFFIFCDYAENGNRILKPTMGLSILYSPFFFISHWYAQEYGYDAGGYSPPYKFGLLMSSLFYLSIGLFFLARLLLRYFTPVISSLVILIVFFGTNLLNYSIFESTLSHAYSFSLLIVFVYFSIKWLEKPSLKTTFLLGFLMGLISLIRPTNVIIGLFLLFWNIKSLDDLKARFILIFRKWWMILVMALICFSIWVPQFIYWKTITGHYLSFSYKGESFFFSNPRIIKGLFSYRKGWFLYTPIMFVAVLSIPLLWNKYKQLFWPVLIIISLQVYIAFSWWCWWYGGGFSARSMVDFYVLLSFPLGALLASMSLWKKPIFIGLTIIVITCTTLGLFFNHKYKHGSIHYDSMTKAAFWNSFWSAGPKAEFYNLLEQPNYEKAMEGIDAINNPPR